MPPLMMSVVQPSPYVRLAALSSAVRTCRPSITSWHDGLGACGVIQKNNAVRNASTCVYLLYTVKQCVITRTGSCATQSGFLSKSSPSALPARP